MVSTLDLALLQAASATLAAGFREMAERAIVAGQAFGQLHTATSSLAALQPLRPDDVLCGIPVRTSPYLAPGTAVLLGDGPTRTAIIGLPSPAVPAPLPKRAIVLRRPHG